MDREPHSHRNLGGNEEVSHGSLPGKVGKCTGDESLETLHVFIMLLSPGRTTWSSSKAQRSCCARLCLGGLCKHVWGHQGTVMEIFFYFICYSFKVRKIYYFSFSTQNMGILMAGMRSVVSDSWQILDYSPLGSSIHGIFQARILDWVAISSYRGSSRPRVQNHVSCGSYIVWWILYHWVTWEANGK